jgi:hypothetical protein
VNTDSENHPKIGHDQSRTTGHTFPESLFTMNQNGRSPSARMGVVTMSQNMQ